MNGPGLTLNKSPLIKASLFAVWFAFVCLLLPSVVWGVTYYVKNGGDNDRDGLSDETAWETLGHVNSYEFQTGNNLFFKCGDTWTGGILKIAWNGTAENEVAVGAYYMEGGKEVIGVSGNRPIIDGGVDVNGEYIYPLGDNGYCSPVSGLCFNYNALVSLEGSHVIFADFEVVHSKGRGIRIWPNDYNTVRNCWVHDNHNCGILIYISDNCVVENCRIWLSGDFAPYARSATTLDWPGGLALKYSSNTIFRNNEVFNNWGEGIIPMASDHISIEDNVVYDNYAAQIYCGRQKYITVKRNLIYNTDAPAFYRSGNPSAGLGFADEPQFADTPERTSNVIVINNLLVGNSQNIFWWGSKTNPTTGGGFINSLIAHNTLINAQSNTNEPLGIVINYGTHTNCRIENNIVVQEKGDIVNGANFDGITFSHNLWSSTPPDYTSSLDDIIGDPQLTKSSWDNLTPGGVSPEWFKIFSTSPAKDRAKKITEVINDYFGSSRGDSPDIGACEYTPPADFSPTDLNQDGRTNIQDIQLCVNVILETETDPDIAARADVNGDGSINALDIQEIVNVILG
ncbi:right-handed parallel beta-helix repeat-containing protein [bacterium]|nr:right-handed parallel beta-helix repeat-containing protein [bacterium]